MNAFSFDGLALLAGVASCLLFCAAHLAVFRFVDSSGVLKWTMIIFGLGLFLCWGLAWSLFLKFPSTFPPPVLISVGLGVSLSTLIYGLSSFLYVLCVWGPYESSIRLRLVRELAAVYPDGLSRDELLARYNNEKIIQRRLARLVRSAEIQQEGGVYRLHNARNFFLIAEWVAGVLRKLIGGSR